MLEWVSVSRRGALAVCASAFLLLAIAPSARGAVSGTGYDISYPQCGHPYPARQAFGIVGVNGGLANDANPCLRRELAWATASPGLKKPSQPPASLYLNTADPGPRVSDWPRSGSDRYGSCHGKWSRSCAYLYGRRRATYSYHLVRALDSKLAKKAPWWLDIETSNSWATSSTHGYHGLNIATIRGFLSGLSSAGAIGHLGIYSNAAWWKVITGLTSRTTASALGSSPRAWTSLVATRRRARRECALRVFTGVRPTLAQYSKGAYDADLRCG